MTVILFAPVTFTPTASQWQIKNPKTFLWSRPGRNRTRDGAGGYTIGTATALGEPTGSLGIPMGMGQVEIRDEGEPGAATKRIRVVTFQNEAGQAPDVQPDDLLSQLDDGTIWTADAVLTLRRTRQVTVFTMVARKP